MHASERSGLRADHENLELSKMRVIEAGLVLFAQHVQVFRPAFLVVCDLVRRAMTAVRAARGA